MANYNPNSTNYEHSFEPNTTQLTMAMDYNSAGQPLIRTSNQPDPNSTSSSLLGQNISSPIIPIIQLNSYDGLRERDTQTYTALGGGVADNNYIDVSCSGTLGSYGVYRSRRFVPHRSGQNGVAKALVKFDTPLAGTQQRIGIANQEQGYYIAYNGTSFQFLHEYGGLAEIWELDIDNTASADQTITLTLNSTAYTIDILEDDTPAIIASKIVLEVSDDVWLANSKDDKVVLLSGSVGPLAGTFTFSSTGNVAGTLTEERAGVAVTSEWNDFTDLPAGLDPTKFNSWQFRWSWESVEAYVLTSVGWRLIASHGIASGDHDDDLPVLNSTFKITAVVYNVGGDTGVTMNVAELYGGTIGEEVITQYTNGGARTATSLSSDTFHHLFSIQNPYVDQNYKINFRTIRFFDLSVATQCNDPVEFYIFFDQPLVSGSTFQWATITGASGERLFQQSTVDATFNTTGDNPVASLIGGLTGSGQSFDLLPYNLVLPPGTHMSLVVRSTASIQKVAAAGTWGYIG